jgi:hypothetical protein
MLNQDDLNKVIIILTDLCRLDDIDTEIHGELVKALNILDPEDI